MWSLWKCRNDIIFRNKTLDVDEVIDYIKFKAWTWLQARTKGFTYSLSEWINCPLSCISNIEV